MAAVWQGAQRREPAVPGSLRRPGQRHAPHPPGDRAAHEDGSRLEARPDGQAEAAERDFWTEAPGFLRTSADLERRWPADQAAAAVDRSRDPAGSWRGDGNQYLNPEQHAEAKAVIAEVQAAEKTLTGRVKEAERDNACGAGVAIRARRAPAMHQTARSAHVG